MNSPALSLHSADEELQAIYDGLAEGVGIIDVETKRFFRVNQAICRTLGYAEKELLAMTLRDLYPPERLAEGGTKLFDAMCRRELNAVECVPYRRKDGGIVYADVTVTSIVYRNRPCLLSFFRDATERKMAADALLASESKLRILFENLPDFVILVNRDGKIEFTNRDSPNARREELVGKIGFDLVMPEYQERCGECVARLMTTGRPQSVEVQDVFGQWWACRGVPITGENGIERVMVICTDVSQERLAAEAVKKEQHLLRRLLELHERERQLIAYEIHDGFAQHLAGAMFRLQAFRDMQAKKPAAAWKEFEAASQFLSRAIDETRQLISGLRPPVLDEFGIVEAVRYLVYENEKSGEPKIEFEHDITADRLAPPLENAIFRIVQESIHNACRHSHSDRIRVSLTQREDRICIDVRDWGVGFDTASVGKQRFGLQGIRERARLLEGRASIESAPNQGTHVCVELPLIGVDDARAVIFDMDGVLVDSYHAHYRSWLEMARADGLHFTEAEFAGTFGRTSREIIAHFWGEGRCTDEQIAEMDERKEAAYRCIVETDFPAMPGIRELLRSLCEAGFKLAVASSGPSENVALAVEKLDAKDLFDAVVTGDDVRHGKPDPEVFTLAAKRLGVRPANCVVIEDAPVGIAAAHAAGMLGIGLLSTGRTRDDLVAADVIVNSLGEISLKMLKGLIARQSATQT